MSICLFNALVIVDFIVVFDEESGYLFIDWFYSLSSRNLLV